MIKYNEQLFNIILEAKNYYDETCNKSNCSVECGDFEDTIGTHSNFAVTIPTGQLKCCEDEVPICKCKKSECGQTECGKREGCKCENDDELSDFDPKDFNHDPSEITDECYYLVDARMLDIYMEDNNIAEASDAVHRICEHYHINPNDMVVVFENDTVNKTMCKNCEKHSNIGLVKHVNCMIHNCLNNGIKCGKKEEDNYGFAAIDSDDDIANDIDITASITGSNDIEYNEMDFNDFGDSNF